MNTFSSVFLLVAAEGLVEQRQVRAAHLRLSFKGSLASMPPLHPRASSFCQFHAWWGGLRQWIALAGIGITKVALNFFKSQACCAVVQGWEQSPAAPARRRE